MDSNVEKLIMESIYSLQKDTRDLSEKVAVLSKSTDIQNLDFSEFERKIEAIKNNVTQIKYDVSEFKTDFDSYKLDTKTLIEQLKKESFPNGDAQSHKLNHERDNERRKSSDDIKKEVTSHIIKGTFWAILVGIIWACAYTIKGWINK